MKSFKEFLIEGGQLNARWAKWLASFNIKYPNPPIEPSYRELLRKKNSNPNSVAKDHMGYFNTEDDVKDGVPPKRSAFANPDVRGKSIGGFFTISHMARLINTKTGVQRKNAASLLVKSNRSEDGDLEFKISKITPPGVWRYQPSGNEKDIHKYILPAGENLNGPWAQDRRFGHRQIPGTSHVLSLSDVSRVIREHMLSTIKTGNPSFVGIPVAEAHKVEL